jgi:uncharacterized protein (TIGR00288 family)
VSNSKRIALLIDCDNVSHRSIEKVLEQLAKHGMVHVRHAHGDWNNPSLSGWRECLHSNAIRPMQQFAYTKGKNATDSAMIIDAMDLLYSGNVDAFALMTSDSDFTPLVLRILENGIPVYGFGEKKTPKPFVDSCSPFIYTENLEISEESEIEGSLVTGNQSENIEAVTVRDQNKAEERAKLRRDTALVKLLRNAAEQTEGDDGWSMLGSVGSYITNNSSFSAINYGYKKLSSLIKVSGLFDMEIRDESVMYIKDSRSTDGE